jgi:hypothetical protein
MTVTEEIFTKLMRARHLVVKDPCTEFHENPTSGLVADARSQTDGPA